MVTVICLEEKNSGKASEEAMVTPSSWVATVPEATGDLRPAAVPQCISHLISS